MSIAVGGLIYLGCHKDATIRDLPDYGGNLPDMTINNCVETCGSQVSIDLLCTAIEFVSIL